MAQVGAAKPLAGLMLALNLRMYIIVCGTVGWAINEAIEHDIVTGVGIPLPNPLLGDVFSHGKRCYRLHGHLCADSRSGGSGFLPFGASSYLFMDRS